MLEKSENIKMWLKELYENEIEEVTKAIENEHMWAIWCKKYQAASIQHEDNAEELRNYVNILKELKQSI